MKTLLITPPYHCGVVEVAGRWLPLTFVYLAGAARAEGFDVEIYDAMSLNHNHDEIRKYISISKPDIVATTAITATIEDAVVVLHTAKELNPSVITILGGIHPTYMYKEILSRNGKDVDYIVRGEGELTFVELLKALSKNGDPAKVTGLAFKRKGKIIATPERPFIEDLDRMPTAYDLLDWKNYTYFVIPRSRLGVVSSSRGCSHDCTFCSQQRFWKRTWRPRRPENVVRDMLELKEKYGTNIFLIADEYPTKDRERWIQFLDLVIENKLDSYILMETRVEDILRDADILRRYREAGIVHIYIGVEATEQTTLDLMRKDIKVEQSREAIRLIAENDMITETSFVLGLPSETKKSIARTLQLAKEYNPDFAHFLAIAPWPYADMYKDLAEHIAVSDYRKYNLIDPVVKPEKMSLKGVDRAIVECYRDFYISKFKEIYSMPDGFKRRYLLSSMKLIMKSSFLKKKMGTLGKIPAEMSRLIKDIDAGC
ncbi:MAG: radical SAM protein [Myxococcota bacterium]